MQKLRTLNPNVVISADVEELQQKSDDYFLRFDVVVMTCHTTPDLVRGVVWGVARVRFGSECG